MTSGCFSNDPIYPILSSAGIHKQQIALVFFFLVERNERWETWNMEEEN